MPSNTVNNSNSNQKSIPGTNRRIISSTNDGTHLVELEAETTLHFYGSKSLDEIDNLANTNFTNSITIISFNYIDFNHISKCFVKIRNKFPNLSVSNFSAIILFNES